jgi:hypothetical protein
MMAPLAFSVMGKFYWAQGVAIDSFQGLACLL